LNLKALRSFRDDHNPKPQHFSLPPSGATVFSLEETLDDSLGILQLKRFARKRFQEENVQFLLEVRQLRGNAQNPLREDEYELVHAAQAICSQFVNPGSPLEINLSDSQRQHTLQAFQACQDNFVRNLRKHSLFEQQASPISYRSQSSPECLSPRAANRSAGSGEAADAGAAVLATSPAATLAEAKAASGSPKRFCGHAPAQEFDEWTATAVGAQVATVFDVAYREILQLVDRGLWEDFKSDRLFEEYTRKRAFAFRRQW